MGKGPSTGRWDLYSMRGPVRVRKGPYSMRGPLRMRKGPSTGRWDLYSKYEGPSQGEKGPVQHEGAHSG